MPSNKRSVDTKTFLSLKSSTAAASPTPFTELFREILMFWVKCLIKPNSPSYSMFVLSLLSQRAIFYFVMGRRPGNHHYTAEGGKFFYQSVKSILKNN